MSKNLSFLLLGTLLVAPFTLHSTDIYQSSHGEVEILANLNPEIVPWDAKLGSTVLIVTALEKYEGIRLVTSCEHRESILHKESRGEKKTMYILYVRFPTSCEVPEVRVGDRENIFIDTLFSLPMQSLPRIESSLINTKSAELLSVMREQPLPISKVTVTTVIGKLQRLQTVYKNLGTVFRSDIARDILRSRESVRYLSPVAGYALPKKDKLIPGAGRPYRRDTTDGIHHGWDIMAPYGTPVQALSKGKIIRIVSDWSWNTFHTLKKWTLTRDDKLRNLDTFRGNQVWLQTLDGNVTFYSHLSKISPDIAVGVIVEAGTYLGNIGISGVPDKNYKDIHLHFEVQKNPFREDMKNPAPLDIMRWNYVGEYMKRKDIYAKMREIFG